MKKVGMQICRLAERTVLRTGGFCFLYRVENINQLASVVARFGKFYCLGNGSNVVISDSGVSLPVIRLAGDFGKIRFEGNNVIAGAGVPLSFAKRSLDGIQNLFGIPATVGGAVYKNAAAFGVSFGEKVKWANVFRAGRLRKISGGEIGFGYRKSSFLKSDVITEVCLELKEERREFIEAEMRKIKLERIKKGFIAAHGTGCVFENPKGYFAGKLIEEIGCGSLRRGGVSVSENHANVFSTSRSFLAKDVFLLSEEIKKRVFDAWGVFLKNLIEFWGNLI